MCGLFETGLHINLMGPSKSYTPWPLVGGDCFRWELWCRTQLVPNRNAKPKCGNVGCWLRDLRGGGAGSQSLSTPCFRVSGITHILAFPKSRVFGMYGPPPCRKRKARVGLAAPFKDSRPDTPAFILSTRSTNGTRSSIAIPIQSATTLTDPAYVRTGAARTSREHHFNSRHRAYLTETPKHRARAASRG